MTERNPRGTRPQGGSGMSEPGGPFSGARRVLLVQLAAIGDVLRAGSVVPALKRAYPGLRVGMLVYEDYADVLSCIPELSYRHYFPNANLKRALNAATSDEEAVKAIHTHAYLPVQDIQCRGYDLAINFHFSMVSAYLTALSGAGKLLGMAPDPEGRMDVYGEEARALYGDLRSPDRFVRSQEHLAVRYHKMCGLPTDGVRLEFDLTLNPGPVLPVPPNAVAIHVGAGWRDKCWPAERWRALITEMRRTFGWTPVLLGTVIERDRNFSSVLDGLDIPVIDYCGKSFLESARALSVCRLFVGADSGPMHLASALDVPVVALFGCTTAAESYPLCGRNAVIQRSRMDEIDVDEVWRAVLGVTSCPAAKLSVWESVPDRSGMILYQNPTPADISRQNVA